MFSLRFAAHRTFARRPRLDSVPTNLRSIRLNARPIIHRPTVPGTRPAVVQPWSPPSVSGDPKTGLCIPRRAFTSTTLRSARYLRFSPDGKNPFDVTRDLGTIIFGGLAVISIVYFVAQ